MIKSIAASLTRTRRGTLAICLLMVAPMLALTASPAMATVHHPTGEFKEFADCPLSQAIEACLRAETTSGEFTVGKRTVPINKTILLQGGLKFNEKTDALEFVAAENGETLSKTALYVPGGLLDIVAPEYLNKKQKEEFEKIVNEGITGVTETTELAAPASSVVVDTENLLDEEGIALSLPTKIKLGNIFLGSSCYVGSNSHPIPLEFTTGATSPPPPNKSIKGSRGTLTFNSEFTLVTIAGGKLVTNSFAAPKAEGCGAPLSFLVDEAVDSELGLPSAAGHNTAILEGKLQEAAAEAVVASE